MRALVKLGLLVAALVIAAVALPSRATAATPVDLELVLAVDISWSMDPEEQQLQRDGYVTAFRDRDVVAAILSGRYRRIAVTYVEWAGDGTQRQVVPWMLVDSVEAAHRFAAELERQPISRNRFTSISGALHFSGALFGKGGFEGTRRVVDVSGDGPNNHGSPVLEARDALVGKGITINGLPIVLQGRPSFSAFDIEGLDSYYAHCVIGGPGAFTIVVRKREEFRTATRRKLILEISGLLLAPRLIPAQATGADDEGYDCMVGEKLWNRYNNRLRVP